MGQPAIRTWDSLRLALPGREWGPLPADFKFLRESSKQKKTGKCLSFFGAANEARTRYLHLGKVALYQMSYGRIT